MIITRIVVLTILFVAGTVSAEVDRKNQAMHGKALEAEEVVLEKSCSLSAVSFHKEDIIIKPGSVINDTVGRYNGYYSFGLTSSSARYDIISKKQLLKAKYEFSVINELREKKGSDHFWEGAFDVVDGVYEGFFSLFTGTEQSYQNIYSAAGKLALKLSDTDGLNDIFSDSPEKRALAAELGLDVYSYNPEVQSFLNNAAEVYSNGKLFGKAVGLLVPLSPVSVAISLGSINADSEDFLNNRSPEEVVRYSRDKLIKMGCKEQVITELLSNQYLNPRSLLYLTDFIWELREVNGAGNVALRYIISARSRIEVETVYYQLEQYSSLHKERTISEIFSCGILMGISLKEDMVPVLIVPYDYFELSKSNENAVKNLLGKASAECEVWCMGTIDQDMRAMLSQQNVKVVLAPFLTSH